MNDTKRQDTLATTLVDMLVHDLRSPLGIITWNMEQLLDGVSGSLNAEQERFVRASVESTQELLEMIDSLLDIGRLESGNIPIEPVECSLEALARDIAGRMDFVTQQMALRFSFDFPQEYPTVRADKQLMRRVLFNLLFNASKYAPEGSRIYIQGGFDGKAIWLAIRDEGHGIAEDCLESIFELYVRDAQPDAKVQTDGRAYTRSKGLGLAFCRLALLSHGGSIRAENASQGARFVLELPLV